MLRLLRNTLLAWTIVAGSLTSLAAQEPVVLAAKPGVVTLKTMGESATSKPTHIYVITHGMGGLSERFLDLARTIKKLEPAALVLIVDWTPGATKGIGSVPTPWAVAPQIDPTAAALAELLVPQQQKSDLSDGKITMIGESFGNYVNFQVAAALRKNGSGPVALALAFNPANELGGYQPPDLGKMFQRSASFHTASPFDTQRRIAQFTLKLETASDDAFEQHTFGIRWLQERLVSGDRSWLRLEGNLGDGSVSVNGMFAKK
jgi:hypothetical protein